MITIFTTAKPFRGRVGVNQRNALRSWTLLEPRPEIFLMGADEGSAEVVEELGLRHVPNVVTNERGTPLVSDLFAQAQKLASFDELCYVNADIVLMQDFMTIAQRFRVDRHLSLVIGRRWEYEITNELQFEPGWDAKIREDLLDRDRRGEWVGREWSGVDYFMFRRGVYASMPPLAVGRTAWDNWLIYAVRSKGRLVADASAAMMVVHQSHDVGLNNGRPEHIWKGAEAKENFALAGGSQNLFTIADSTHFYSKDGQLRRALGFPHNWRQLYTLALFNPWLRPAARLVKSVLALSWPLREKFGWVNR